MIWILKRIWCLVFRHDWTATWHGQDYYEYGWKKNFEGLGCLRCGHPGLRFENGKRLPLLENAPLTLGPVK